MSWQDVIDQAEAPHQRAAAWLKNNTHEAADAAAAEERAQVLQQHTRNNIALVTEQSLNDYESQFRTRRDEAAQAEAEQIIAGLAQARQEIAVLVAEREPLPSLLTRYKGTSNELLALSVELQAEQHARTQFAGRTLEMLLELYLTIDDKSDAHNMAIRVVESHVLSGETSRLGLVADRKTDMKALRSLGKAVAARRHARVPEGLRKAHTRVHENLPVTFTSMVGYLKTGIGIAARPRTHPMKKAIA